MYDIIFITTFVDDKHINSLLSSVERANDTLRVFILVLCQNSYDISVDSTPFVHFERIVIPGKICLSKARNICLDYIRQNGIQSQYVMFPDDDSVFDSLFFNNFRTHVSGNTLMAVKATQDRETYFIKMPDKQFASKYDYRYAISVNMIVKQEVLNAVGEFDEKLGVGNYYGAGEDNDFFIRCNEIECFSFSNSIWNYHPIQNNNINKPVTQLVQRYKSYGRGVMYMLLKHKMHRQALNLIIRGYLGAVLCLFRLNFKMTKVYFLAANERLRIFLQ